MSTSTVLKLDPQKRYTYADLLTWPENERWELIDGVPYLNGVPYGDASHAVASPNWKHQKISVRLTRRFDEYLEDKVCEIYRAPFDVRLNIDEGDDIVVQPDLLVICNPEKIDDKGCNGAPDFVIEILSPPMPRTTQ